MSKSKARSNLIWSIVMTIVCVIYMYPIFMVLMNSLKVESAISTSTAFQLPNSETFAGLDNYVNAITSRGFFASFGYTLFITVSSVAAILLCCSMFAWYITRVRSWVTKALYLLCAFSMVVPFQMVMFTLSSLADSMRINFFGLYTLRFNTPWMLWFVYLGFGAGLAVFMFSGFVKSIPLEIEEAAVIDGCGPLRTFFRVVLPMLKPTMISVGVLEIMWVWNDYLLPSLVLDINQYRTIPIHIQYLKGSYGTVDMGATMALIMLSILPVIIFYLCCQKHIIKGVAAGAVKG